VAVIGEAPSLLRLLMLMQSIAQTDRCAIELAAREGGPGELTARRTRCFAEPRRQAEETMAEAKALAGKVAIVTGSGKNIGKAITEALAEDGAAVVINGRGDRAIIEDTAHCRSAGNAGGTFR
jgi:3-oxoacyl-ACP reductase-like protein